ncbi:MAG: asparagine synthase, partial [Myxococcales bacterium]|nr:asparagine synthase [Myxococcales bacterium]
LRVAVADRSRGTRLMAADASGGVDSSTVVALLAERLRKAGREPPLLLHMRCVGLTCDEGRFAQSLARHVGAPLFEVDGAPVRFGPEGIAELDMDDVWCGPSHALHSEAHRRGARVCFTGQGSDELQFRFLLVEDALATREWMQAARFAGLFEEPHRRSSWMKLVRAGLRTWGPKGWFRDRDERRAADRLPAWLASRGRQAGLEGLRVLARFPDSHPSSSPLRRVTHAELVFSQQTSIFAQAEMSFGRAHGLELLQVYCDARVVSAFLSLPTRMRASYEIAKPTLRAIAQDLLPPALTWKYPGMDYAPFLHAGWLRARAEWTEIGRGTELENLGLVDGAKLRAATESGFLSGQLDWDVHNALRAEAWLRRLRRKVNGPREGSIVW